MTEFCTLQWIRISALISNPFGADSHRLMDSAASLAFWRPPTPSSLPGSMLCAVVVPGFACVVVPGVREASSRCEADTNCVAPQSEFGSIADRLYLLISFITRRYPEGNGKTIPQEVSCPTTACGGMLVSISPRVGMRICKKE